MAIANVDLEALYLAKQSAKGTPNTTLKMVSSYTSYNSTMNKEEVPIPPGLGRSFYTQPSFNGSFIGESTADGILTLSRLPSHIFSPFCSFTTDATAAPIYTHTYVPLASNTTMPWFTSAAVYGKSGTPGLGIQTKVMRDTRITSASFMVAGGEAPSFNLGFNNLNEGVGAGTETFSIDSDFYMPIPSDSTSNLFTPPSWWPSVYCIQSINNEWANQATNAGPCLNSGEYADILTTQAGWTLTMQLPYDANSKQIYNHMTYLTNTSIPSYSAVRPGYKEGAFSYKVSTQQVIPTTIVPYSLTVNFPDLQWISANISSGQTPVMVEVVAKSFGTNWTAVVVNDKTNAQMTL